MPRTYGYSPFAYPLGTPTPEITITDVAPKMMINPYVPRSQPSAATTEKTAGGPLMILNPFVDRAVELAGDGE